MQLKRGLLLTYLFISGVCTYAQDPSFSQFFSSPLNINPALTGSINGSWRVISNIRSQWAGPVYPYVTGTASFDAKLLKDKVPENHVLGAGAMMMFDKAMGGVEKQLCVH